MNYMATYPQGSRPARVQLQELGENGRRTLGHQFVTLSGIVPNLQDNGAFKAQGTTCILTLACKLLVTPAPLPITCRSQKRKCFLSEGTGVVWRGRGVGGIRLMKYPE